MLTHEGGPRRRPWRLLDILTAPVKEQWVMKQARGVVVRLSSKAIRAYDVKYSVSPYDMYPLTFARGNTFSAEAQDERAISSRTRASG